MPMYLCYIDLLRNLCVPRFERIKFNFNTKFKSITAIPTCWVHHGMWPGYHIVTGSVACLINPVGSYFFNTKSVESGATDGTRCPRCAMIIVIGNSSKCSGWTNPTKTTWHGCRDIFVAAWPTWLVVQVEVRGASWSWSEMTSSRIILSTRISQGTKVSSGWLSKLKWTR